MLFKFIVSADTGIQNGISDGSHQVTVIVCAAQPFCCQHFCVHHHHIRQVTEIVIPQGIFRVNGELNLLVSGDMRIAKEGTAILFFIRCTGSIEAVPGKFIRQYLSAEGRFFKAKRRILVCNVVQQSEKIPGQVADIARHQQPSYGIIFQDLVRSVVQLLGIHRLIEKQRILSQYRSHVIILAVLGDAGLGQSFQKERPPGTFVHPKIIKKLFCRFGEPVPFILLGAVVPSTGKITRSKLFRLDGYRCQELIVKLGQRFRRFLAHIGDIQGMIIFLEGFPVIIPVSATVPEPIKGLELTCGEDHINALHRMHLAPGIFNHFHMVPLEEILKIHLVQHSLHIGHTDLKRRMDMRSAVGNVQLLRKGFGDQPLAVKAGDFDLLKLFLTVEFPGNVGGSIVPDGDHELPVGS